MSASLKRRFLAGVCGVALLLILPLAASAQGTLYTLLTNGPAAKRINIVVLAEGYTTGQTNLFLTDATNAVNNLLAQQPYQEYKNYFNAYAIFVVSAEAGSDHPPGGPLKNTYFNSTYYSYGNPDLLTIPPNDIDGNYSHGQGKVDSLLAALFPQYDLALMVVNDLEYGGSGGSTLISSVHIYSPEIVVHESGHTFGNLADEYSDPYPGFVPVEKPNATAITNRASLKWTSWVLGSTPIPTAPDPTNAAIVGVFKGAQYQTSGWYRPKLDCKMNHLFVPFCEVCSEQLVKSIYGQVRPTDSIMPASTNFGIYSTQTVAFAVTPLQPLTHNLNFQWFTNNVAVSSATSASFNLSPKAFGNGVHTLKAVVSDGTALVRNDPSNLLKQTNIWSLTISLNELSLISERYLATNRFRFTVTGSAPSGFVIQASTNLLNWIPISTNTLTGGKFDFTNSNLTIPYRFYRTISPP